MSKWKEDIRQAMKAFEQVTELAGVRAPASEWQLEFLDAPHRQPSSLPSGMMAVYGFWGDGEWLKIGMAGVKSKARYTSQHYNAGSAPSTLAASLARDSRMAAVTRFDQAIPGEWIRQCCHRVNIVSRASRGRPMLALLEAFLHVRLNPRHER